ncbi:MAG: hypothetical protein JNK84_11790 [Phreatobacter sp.]|uniref:hypothetical protein n=1 Tax=Phreatobacter sp. TaxID=1966341 RepID=UPI001A41415B|nr:hypothetical protein [Phreatobacter sp.]MBL8569752.1 hypothetical protein [Phreatobacter sp.]
MAQTQSSFPTRRDNPRRIDGLEAMLSLLGRMRPQSDSEAFAILRRSFPASPLCERVAVVSRWRAG